MDKKIYKITLADGTIIDNLTLNGNNYVSEVEIDETIFYGNCSPVTINDGTHDVVHDYMELIQVMELDGKYLFILRDIPESKLKEIKTQSDIEYIAMMTGVEL